MSQIGEIFLLIGFQQTGDAKDWEYFVESMEGVRAAMTDSICSLEAPSNGVFVVGTCNCSVVRNCFFICPKGSDHLLKALFPPLPWPLFLQGISLIADESHSPGFSYIFLNQRHRYKGGVIRYADSLTQPESILASYEYLLDQAPCIRIGSPLWTPAN